MTGEVPTKLVESCLYAVHDVTVTRHHVLAVVRDGLSVTDVGDSAVIFFSYILLQLSKYGEKVE